MADMMDVVFLALLFGGGYIAWKNGILGKVYEQVVNIPTGGGRSPPGTSSRGDGSAAPVSVGTCGGGTGFGGPHVELHGLASGGQQWRKEWIMGVRFLNAEFCGYFYIPAGPAGETISIKMRGGPHTGSGDNATTRQGCCYIFCLPFGGSNKNNFQKECPHPQYAKNSVPVKFNAGSILKKWVGVRCSTINEGSGVRCRMSLDTTSNKVGGNQWREWYNILDTGQYGQSSATKPPFTKSPVYGTHAQVGVRIDSSTKGGADGYKMSNAAVREVGTAARSSYVDVDLVDNNNNEVKYSPTAAAQLQFMRRAHSLAGSGARPGARVDFQKY